MRFRFCYISRYCLKPLDPFGTEKQKQVHRLTNNLQGLQKVVVKCFSLNIIPWNALLFEKTVKQYQFSLRELRIYFKHMSWHGETRWYKGGFSPDSDDR